MEILKKKFCPQSLQFRLSKLKLIPGVSRRIHWLQEYEYAIKVSFVLGGSVRPPKTNMYSSVVTAECKNRPLGWNKNLH